jgi:GTP-binding protein
MADIPGLIEGASEGRGLGHEFLRHLERTKVIAYILDAFPIDGSDPLETLALLQRELSSYDEKLFARRSVVVLNKIDLAEGEDDGAAKLDSLREAIARQGLSVFLISGIAKDGLVALKEALYNLVVTERRIFEAELASRMPVVKGLMSAQSLGLSDHGLESFMDFMNSRSAAQGSR